MNAEKDRLSSIPDLLRRLARGWGLLIALLIAWEMISRLWLVDPILLPPPTAILRRGLVLLRSGRLLGDLAASAWRVFVGFGIAVSLALPLGIALGLYPRLQALSDNLFSILRPLSPPAWIPIAILWFGIGDMPSIFIIFVGTFFSLLVATRDATKSVDPQLVKAALTLGASRWQSILHVILPALLPAFITQLRVGVGLAWMCVIAAEMVAVRRGIGFLMIEARNLFRTDDVIVGMITIGLAGLGSDRLLARLDEVLCGWRAGLEASQMYGSQDRT